jgi:ESS family glutamate:Na+ symporter
MTISPLLTALLAVPVLLLGEWLVRRVPWLERVNIPAPVLGGLLVALLVLGANLALPYSIRFPTTVSAAWWTWIVTIEPEWAARPARSLSVPLLGAFYVCVGLNSTWAVVRRGSVQVVMFLGVATLLGVVQNVVGVALAKAMGLHPLMGVLGGSLTMTGGHGTTLGFAPQFEAGVLASAAVIGSALATMGLVVGSLLGGPVGGWLICRHRLQSEAPRVPSMADAPAVPRAGLGPDLHTLWVFGGSVAKHLVCVLLLVKAGAWASYFLAKTGVAFPVHIGAMLLATVARNLIDLLAPGWI